MNPPPAHGPSSCARCGLPIVWGQVQVPNTADYTRIALDVDYPTYEPFGWMPGAGTHIVDDPSGRGEFEIRVQKSYALVVHDAVCPELPKRAAPQATTKARPS